MTPIIPLTLAEFASQALTLTATDVAIAGVLILATGAVSVFLQLGLEKSLLIATVRTVLQLLLIGMILRWVFALQAWWAVALIVLVMLTVAAHAAIDRPTRRIRRGMWIAWVSLTATALLTCWIVTHVVVGVQPWYQPRYVIPLLGMILGNGLNGISLCLDSLLDAAVKRQGQIEMELAHGATGWEAARPLVTDAVRRGMVPIINSMMVVGLVSLPGMMTGQILAGADPMQAVLYQIVVMFMIAAATAGASMMIALMVHRRLFNARHQLLLAAVSKKGK